MGLIIYVSDGAASHFKNKYWPYWNGFKQSSKSYKKMDFHAYWL